MPGGLLDMSFLAGGMDMHACTVDSATTSTQSIIILDTEISVNVSTIII